MKIFVSPHNDDETLFGTFTILREKPLVVVVFDSYVQTNRGLAGTWQERRAETEAAMEILGVGVQFLGFRDDDGTVTPDAIGKRLDYFHGTQEFLPAFERDGHYHHNTVALARTQATRYLTYTTAGKSVSNCRVPIEDPNWIELKLKALSCYKSQFNLDPRMGCWPHFLRDQTEYYAT